MIGQTIAHYRVSAKIGAGGMGEVYRASDTKLGRDVALKVLPAAFASDAERMARFEREAQVLASLNHPNIATIHGLEVEGSIRALAMELVEGPTLSERIAQGAIPLDDALLIAKQIAEALEYAHDRGIVHRDLKPANIKLTVDGKVKVLDFGLAKALSEDSSASSGSVDFSPTLSMAATKAGIILGTAAYMAPEQARGKPVDRRADIWSFGIVLFEMLTGRRAFHGEDATEILASVIKTEPEWEALPADTPAQVRKLLRRCLEKDARRRLQAIGEARIQIEEVMADSSAATAVMTAVTSAPVPAWRRALPWAVAGVMTLAFGVALVALLRNPAPPEPAVTRFEIDMGSMTLMLNGAGSRVAVSPDGRKIVVTANRAGGTDTQLYLRSMDNLEFVAMPGTEGATQPFFSPDGQWVGFSAGGKLKKVSLAGGVPVTLCEFSGTAAAAAWGDNGTIFFTSRGGELNRIPEGGGTPEKVAVQDPWKAEGPRWLAFLPSSRGVLLVFTGHNQFHIEVLSLETGKRERIVEAGSWPRYLSTGHILYAQYASGSDTAGFTGGLLAVPFDLKKLARTGSPIPVLEGVKVGSGGAGYYDVAANGMLVYAPGTGGTASMKNLSWVDRKGKVEKLSLPPHHYDDLRISPDGTRVTMTINETTPDIYVCDLRRGTLQRLTFDARNGDPVFTPDGSRVVYDSNSGTGTAPNLWWKPADGSGNAERLTTSEFAQVEPSISHDGKTIAFMEFHTDTNADIYVLSMEGERKARPFLNTKFREADPVFSPDGKWIAYDTDESGKWEVYVQPYPGPGGKWQISTGGGSKPAWSRDGKQLYYLGPKDALMAVDVTTHPTFLPGKPRVVLEGLELSERGNRNYDVTADGRVLFAPLVQQAQEERNLLRVVENFFTDIRRRTPTGKNQ
jgi:Tol biopolymer transport system component